MVESLGFRLLLGVVLSVPGRRVVVGPSTASASSVLGNIDVVIGRMPVVEFLAETVLRLLVAVRQDVVYFILGS